MAERTRSLAYLAFVLSAYILSIKFKSLLLFVTPVNVLTPGIEPDPKHANSGKISKPLLNANQRFPTTLNIG